MCTSASGSAQEVIARNRTLLLLGQKLSLVGFLQQAAILGLEFSCDGAHTHQEERQWNDGRHGRHGRHGVWSGCLEPMAFHKQPVPAFQRIWIISGKTPLHFESIAWARDKILKRSTLPQARTFPKDRPAPGMRADQLCCVGQLCSTCSPS